MCGRYYVDDDTAKEIRRLVRKVENKLKRSGDVRPSQQANVIVGEKTDLLLTEMTWGFPKFSGSGLLINARAETALERKMFRNSMLHRRCIIPARGFYEWDRDKNKATFTRKDGSLLYLAGFYDMFQEIDRFVIITVNANESVRPVHDRMPLVLEEEELEDWVWDDRFMETALRKTPAFLHKEQRYEQQSLF